MSSVARHAFEARTRNNISQSVTHQVIISSLERKFDITFSIVACDLEEQAWGVAVASKFPAVGAVVPWAQADAGAVATQSFANTSFGPRGLALMATGLSAQEALD